MRLDKVELLGFKSFCDKQEISFQGGVTGIVGPNGCGKSNISDAISWVLGEQSAKSLRGSSMEDVIFAGSQIRQPLAMAEVSLKVSGLNGNSPDGNPEAVVTRRLYRDGTSEYLINGEVRRLKDIHEIFMDTGLGSKAYSIIEQGKIGLILSSKPADRRGLIEEAAGITKYRARRRQTQLKLEAAQANLLRVNDIIHEVEKQLEGLKRQASKARRYRALREEMQGVERVLFGRRFEELHAQSGHLETRLGEETERERHAAVSLETEEAQMEARRVALYEEEERLASLRNALGELTLAVNRHESASSYCKEQIKDAQARAAEAETEGSDLDARLTPFRAELDGHRNMSTALREELAGAEEAAARAENTARESARHLANAHREQEERREAQVNLLGRIATLQNASVSITGNADRAAADLLKLATEIDDLVRERARVDETRRSWVSQSSEAERALETLRDQHQEAVARAETLRVSAHEAEAEIVKVQSGRDGLVGRRSSLLEIVATHAAFDEGVRALLQMAPMGSSEAASEVAALFERRAVAEIRGVVADSVETDSHDEKAVEAFLADHLQAILVPDAPAAQRAIDYLHGSDAGRCAFLPLTGPRNDAASARLREIALQEPAVRALLSDLYRTTGPFADEIRAAMPDALVVETLREAIDLANRRGPLPIVTLQGEVLHGALVTGGRNVRGLLAPRREIKEIESHLEGLETRLVATKEGLRDLEDRAIEASVEAKTLEERIHAAEKEHLAIRHNLSAAEEESARLERKSLVLATERTQAEQERGAAAMRLAEIASALQTAEGDRASGAGHLAALADTVDQARIAVDEAQSALAETRSRVAALRERLAAAEATLVRLDAVHQDLGARLVAARGRREEMILREAQLSEEVRTAERDLAEALLDRDRTSGDIGRIDAAVRDVKTEIESRDVALKEKRREREILRDAISELTVAKARCDSDLDHLARESHQSLGQTAAECSMSLTDDDKVADVPSLEARLSEVREKIERMGPVNVLAVEQTQELEERSAFMTAQRQDLVDSIAEMDRAIRGIDKTSRERFAEAFSVINEHFGTIFRQLFGGGTAGLSLIDEEDLLESGIDVMAQPPGKRFQNVMLLSGGEKALTAIALLFAIFQYKPSPFCILDEVDAPLDDANIGRFVRMLESLKEQTQFVLITHSRKTMEIADHLYGVTMEEPGVSKLVSVRFS